MAFTYYLPNANNQKVAHTTVGNSVVIIGANGSGKSKLGAWIEQQAFSEVHRIGAQRSLNFNENIALKSYTQAEDLVFFGSDGSGGYKEKKGARWGWGSDTKYTTTLLSDFENVLAALLAIENNENSNFVKTFTKAVNEHSPIPNPPVTAVQKLKQIWNSVLPQRALEVDDAKFYAVVEKNGILKKYPANQMSDGERSVLYLAAQVLCVPKNKTLM